MRVELDEPKCVGSGQCVLTAPEAFGQREDNGVAIVMDEAPAADLHQAARQAAAVCPTTAIRVVERGAVERVVVAGAGAVELNCCLTAKASCKPRPQTRDKPRCARSPCGAPLPPDGMVPGSDTAPHP